MPSEREVLKLEESTDTLAERLNIAESKLNRTYKRIAETFDDKAVQIARYLHNEVENLGGEPDQQLNNESGSTFEIKRVMSFDLS